MQVCKKKIIGKITSFEEDNSITEKKRRDVHVEAQNKSQPDVIRTSELKEFVLASSHTGSEGIERGLQAKKESNDIDSENCEKCYQIGSLEGMVKDLVVFDEDQDNTPCHTDEMRTSRILGMFERRKWRKALQSATSSKKKQKDAETVHQVDYVSSGGKETMLTTDQQSNVVTGDVLSKPMPSSSAKKKWNKFMSKKKDHPTRSGIIIEREHVYDIYREDNEDFDDVL